MIRRDQRGVIDPFTGLIIAAVVLATAATFGTLISIATSEDYGPGGPKVENPIALASFEVPPNNDCGKRVQELFQGDVKYVPKKDLPGIEDKDYGWQSTEMSRPTPPPRPDDSDPRYRERLKEYNPLVLAYNAQASKWNSLMRIRMAAYYKELNEQDCNKVQPSIDQASPQNSESQKPELVLAGTYSLSWSGVNCTLEGNWEKDVTGVSIGGGGASITFAFIGGSENGVVYTMAGRQDPDGGSYDLNNEAALIYARFGRFGERIQIDGSYRYNGPEATCTGLFTGVKN